MNFFDLPSPSLEINLAYNVAPGSRPIPAPPNESTPPRTPAAFDAADKHGIYLQVELPNWSFQMGKRPLVDKYFRAEGERIIAEYGDHPSFVMFCLGNELAGDLGFMDGLVIHFRALDPDKLYTSTSFAFSPRGKKPGPEDDYFITQEGTDIRNSWSVWVYPPVPDTLPKGVEIHRSTGAKLTTALAAGKRVLLLVSDRTLVKKTIDARFIPVFWSPLHFRNQPGTFGATIDSTHPVFSAFPTDTFTNWQWWELFSTSFAMDLDALAVKPEMPLRFVDKFDRNALPAAIWQTKVGAGRLLVCTLDVESEPVKRIAARQLKSSILAYMASDAFAPSVAMDGALVQSLFNPATSDLKPAVQKATIPASSALCRVSTTANEATDSTIPPSCPLNIC